MESPIHFCLAAPENSDLATPDLDYLRKPESIFEGSRMLKSENFELVEDILPKFSFPNNGRFYNIQFIFDKLF